MYQTQITFLNNAETHLHEIHTRQRTYSPCMSLEMKDLYIDTQYERSSQQLMRLFRKQKYFVAHKK